MDNEIKKLRSHYRKDLWRAKQGNQENIWIRLLAQSKTTNSREFWRTVNRISTSTNIHCNAGIPAAACEPHIRTAYANRQDIQLKEQVSNLSPDNIIQPTSSGEVKIPSNKLIDKKLVELALKRLKTECAPGPNGLPNEFYKHGKEF